MSRANLDLNDKLVKRGLLVSWHGHRAIVQRARTGRCLVKFQSAAYYPRCLDVATRWLPCASVQVVAP